MKKPLVFIGMFLFVCIYSSGIRAQWEWVVKDSPTQRVLRSVSFVDSLNGWACGDSGTIIHTSDAGENWVIQESNVEGEIVDIFFLNGQIGWAVAWNMAGPFGTLVLHTTDGGAVWDVKEYSVESIFMRTIYFLDSLNGWMGGFPGEMVFTTDGGDQWEQANIDSGGASGFPVLNFNFYNDQYGYANGGHIDLAGVIWRTTNYGQSWASTVLGPEPIQELYFFDSLNVIGVGGDFDFGSAVVRTTNGGDTWDYTTLGVFGIALAVSFRNDLEGWSPIGFTQKFIYTSDGGNTWVERPTPEGTAILDLVFTDSRHGYAVGAYGAILKYEPVVAIEPVSPNSPGISSPRLLQNYPNPFNPVTTIAFSLPNRSRVTLTVYDALGREVMRLLNGERTAGNYELTFDGSELPSGMYYYQLRTHSISGGETHTLTRRMLLVK